jgi:predicted HicB family RNase H-like nuclease
MAATRRKPLTFDVDRSPRTTAESKAKSSNAQQVGARVTSATYRQLKARAALQGVSVQSLVEQAIDEFLQNHPAPKEK